VFGAVLDMGVKWEPMFGGPSDVLDVANTAIARPIGAESPAGEAAARNRTSGVNASFFIW